MPDETPMLRAAMQDGLILRILEGQTARMGHGQALLLQVQNGGGFLLPLPMICTFAELLQRLENLKSILDVRDLLAKASLGEGVPVVIRTQDGGETAFLTDAEESG